MQNTEYDREFIFDIDAYLIDWYPKMNLPTRRAVCSIALSEWLDEADLYETVDSVVAHYAQTKLDLLKAEEEEEDEEDEEEVDED